jgi:mannose-1-phosphate guanylyltransferase
MPTLIPVILAFDEHAPDETPHDVYKELFSHSHHAHESLFESTLECALTLAKPDQVITVAPFEYAPIIHEQLAKVHLGLKNNVLLTPSPFKPSAAITIAAHHALAKFTDPVLWIIPVHQTTYYSGILKHAVTYSMRAAFQGNFVLFGMKPFKPDTRYAYLVNGKHFEGFDRLHHLRMLVPHPSEQTIESMWQQPYCLASSGIVLACASYWLNSAPKNMRDGTLDAYKHSKESLYGPLMNQTAYSELTAQSLTKYLGLMAQQNNHSLTSYTLPTDTSKHNGWYQLWQQSQAEGRGGSLERFLSHINRAA